MNITVNFIKQAFSKSKANLILFVDEKFNIKAIKKLISHSEYSYILDLISKRDNKKKNYNF